MSDSLVVVGNDGGTNIGASLRRAAHSAGVPTILLDARAAFRAPGPIARFNWWIRERRPTRLKSFSEHVVETCRDVRPRWLIATGIAPIVGDALNEIRRLGTETINYLTDDPWNPAFRSAWFLRALPGYGWVFSPRTRNLADLSDAGCEHVEYLPFGVDPDLFFPEDPAPGEADTYRSDVCFAGGAEPDRVSFMGTMVRAGLDVAVYGDHWDRYAETRAAWRGHAAPSTLRKATRAAGVALCLVRRANRDGHTMRTFEVPSIGGCMLVEDTDDHRMIFGDHGRAVLYFRSATDAVASVRTLLNDPQERSRLADAARALITSGRHTYQDRLSAMLAMTSGHDDECNAPVTGVATLSP